jgi:hypothetical protein
VRAVLAARAKNDMALKLNQAGFDHAKQLVNEDHFVSDQRDAWSDDQPSTEEENEFIEAHGFHEYSKWHLGIDDAEPEATKKKYKFPYGDFLDVHRCALISAESRAGQYKHFDVERAAIQLREMIDAQQTPKARGQAS